MADRWRPVHVIGGTHKGKTGKISDVHISKTGRETITVSQENGVSFKTLSRNVEVAHQAEPKDN